MQACSLLNAVYCVNDRVGGSTRSTTAMSLLELTDVIRFGVIWRSLEFRHPLLEIITRINILKLFGVQPFGQVDGADRLGDRTRCPAIGHIYPLVFHGINLVESRS